ncbi:hypothetical protein [Streptomyces netropsis]|uniref:Uncharacterized protein n=1 Tax=Streptomyces netropsis TaxID=55404 RepID=A0A7W7LHM4_STRNE|nr:hypothetical protein [Streptomyces netropsis]MBB4889856.1 hypothetical protein [Streptomyces netropsis]GGR41601.1 hypothetical protein GCM10010219_53610 [Streptomyces netropsis]
MGQLLKRLPVRLSAEEEEKVERLLSHEVTRQLFVRSLPGASDEEIVEAVRKYVRGVTKRLQASTFGVPTEPSGDPKGATKAG